MCLPINFSYESCNEYSFHNKPSILKNPKIIAINEQSIQEMTFSLNINSFKKTSWESYTKLLYVLILLKIPKTYQLYLGQGKVEHLKRHTWLTPKETAWKPAMKFTSMQSVKGDSTS